MGEVEVWDKGRGQGIYPSLAASGAFLVVMSAPSRRSHGSSSSSPRGLQPLGSMTPPVSSLQGMVMASSLCAPLSPAGF